MHTLLFYSLQNVYKQYTRDNIYFHVCIYFIINSFGNDYDKNIDVRVNWSIRLNVFWL